VTELAVETVRPEVDDAPFSRVCAVTEVEASAELARYRGVIDPVWTRVVAWNADNVPTAGARATRELIDRCCKAKPNGAALFERFEALTDAEARKMFETAPA